MDIIETFLADLDSLSLQYIERIKQVFASGATETELAILVSETNFFREFLGNEFDGRLNKFFDEYDDELAKLIAEAQRRGVSNLNRTTLPQLQTLKDLELGSILRRADDYDSQLRSELLKQLITGKSSKEITDTLLPEIQKRVVFNPSWFGSMLNTSYQNYNAATTESLFEDEPETKWILTGPDDARTRQACRFALDLFQEKYKDGLTIKEINSGKIPYINSKGGVDTELKYNFINRGGFNCRHTWELV